ncbi:MAG: ACT domain-containing protein [Oscillospiraceae bacterium]
MKAIITVVGRDAVGILAKAASICASHHANIIDVTQTVMGDLFSMVMLADIATLTCDFSVLSTEMETAVSEMGLVAHVMHEDIFNAMHRI